MEEHVVDAKTAGAICELSRLKDACVVEGSYAQARHLKLAVERLKVMGHNIHTTEAARYAALEREAYDLARLLGEDVAMLHAARERVVRRCTNLPPDEPEDLGMGTKSEDSEPAFLADDPPSRIVSPPRKRGRLRKCMAPRRAELEGYTSYMGKGTEVDGGNAAGEEETGALRKHVHSAYSLVSKVSLEHEDEGEGEPEIDDGDDYIPYPQARRGRGPRGKKRRAMRAGKVKPEAGGSIAGASRNSDLDTQQAPCRRSRNPFRIPQSHLEMCPVDAQGIRWIGCVLGPSPASCLPLLRHFSTEQQWLLVAEAQRLYSSEPHNCWVYLNKTTSNCAVAQVLLPEVRFQNKLPAGKWPQMSIVGDASCFMPQQRKTPSSAHIHHCMHENYVLRFIVDMGGRHSERTFELYAPMELLDKDCRKDLRVKIWLPIVPDGLDTRATRNFTYLHVTRKIHSRRTWDASFWAQAEQYVRRAVRQHYPHKEHLLGGDTGGVVVAHDISSATTDPSRLLLVLAGAVEEAEAEARSEGHDSQLMLESALSKLHYGSAYALHPSRPQPQPPLLHPTSHSLPYFPPVVAGGASPPFTSPLPSPAYGILYVAPADIHPRHTPPVAAPTHLGTQPMAGVVETGGMSPSELSALRLSPQAQEAWEGNDVTPCGREQGLRERELRERRPGPRIKVDGVIWQVGSRGGQQVGGESGRTGELARVRQPGRVDEPARGKEVPQKDLDRMKVDRDRGHLSSMAYKKISRADDFCGVREESSSDVGGVKKESSRRKEQQGRRVKEGGCFEEEAGRFKEAASNAGEQQQPSRHARVPSAWYGNADKDNNESGGQTENVMACRNRLDVLPPTHAPKPEKQQQGCCHSPAPRSAAAAHINLHPAPRVVPPIHCGILDNSAVASEPASADSRPSLVKASPPLPAPPSPAERDESEPARARGHGSHYTQVEHYQPSARLTFAKREGGGCAHMEAALPKHLLPIAELISLRETGFYYERETTTPRQ